MRVLRVPRSIRAAVVGAIALAMLAIPTARTASAQFFDPDVPRPSIEFRLSVAVDVQVRDLLHCGQASTSSNFIFMLSLSSC